MHEYQRLQDLIIKIPDYPAKNKIEFKSAYIRVNYNTAIKHKKRLIFVMYLLYLWTGSYPEIIKARHSIAAFSLRKGMPVGVGLTLHRRRMQAFIQSLFISLANSEKSKFKVAKTGPASLGLKNFYDLSPLALSLLDYKFLHSNKEFGISITLNIKNIRNNTKNTENSKEKIELTKLGHKYLLSQYLLPSL